jgi:hypothetical protein
LFRLSYTVPNSLVIIFRYTLIIMNNPVSIFFDNLIK